MKSSRPSFKSILHFVLPNCSKADSKLDKTQELCVKILDEAEFLKLL